MLISVPTPRVPIMAGSASVTSAPMAIPVVSNGGSYNVSRATARVFEIDPNTVLQWLVAAAEQLHAFSAYFLHDLHLNQIQLDELYAVLSAVRDGELREDEAIDHLSP